MKKILGLDLGTTSIGWALVHESDHEESEILKVGVRIIPLSTDEQNDFNKGKSISINSDRTLKRGARRNLQRYKLRRNELIEVLGTNDILNNQLPIAENGKFSTHSLWELRSNAATEKISLNDFARVLLAINKKRGYKSNRKAKDEGDGQAIDGMDLAKKLYLENLTPGQLMLQRLKDNIKGTPDFYQSDLQNEFNRIWEKQIEFYPEGLSQELKRKIETSLKDPVWKICQEPWGTTGIKRTEKKQVQTLENYQWRTDGLTKKITLEQLVIVLQEIRGKIKGSSGYLGAISDRSKELYFNKITVGQYLYNQIKETPHNRLKGQVFYRQDYLDEFEQIWNTQAQYHKQLTQTLKEDIRDVIIFFQRKLKSQKGLISVCELEGFEKQLIKNGKPVYLDDGKPKMKWIGPKVCPKSSPLFQEFKIWQKLNDLAFKNIQTKELILIRDFDPDLDFRNNLFDELNIKGDLTDRKILSLANLKANDGWEVNLKNGLDGNKTNESLYKAYQRIIEFSGHDVVLAKLPALEAKDAVSSVFQNLGIDSSILDFDAELDKKDFEKQSSYQFWHLLYSYEGDDSKTGNEKLLELLKQKFGFEKEYAKLLVNVVFKDDYGSLSSKAMRKIITPLKAGHDYTDACVSSGYNHSHSLTNQENENRKLEDALDLLPKNSLRNPVVEKILNQLVNVINAIIKEHGKPDEIRIELARELKKSANERSEMTNNINKATIYHDKIRTELEKINPFNQGVRITRNDIIKYKLWKELESSGYKTIYTQTYVPLEKLFSKEFDIEHIIPKAKLFDDSFSNKTLSARWFNEKKGNKTGVDAVEEILGTEAKETYLSQLETLLKGKHIKKAKYNKLKMTEKEIPDGFIDRDLRNSQYIAKKAMAMLHRICRDVNATSGSITNRLRQDWQLVDVMKELNWEKYEKLGLVANELNKHGNKIKVIKDWSKRNDHRHHIMDAITVAFTKHEHVQYFNFLNARQDETNKQHYKIKGIQDKETRVIETSGKRIMKPPMPLTKFRQEAKIHLEKTLVSFKAKNKVVTRNKNKTKGSEVPQKTFTPRGQLHKETLYGMKQHYVTKEEKVNASFVAEKIKLVANQKQRLALLERLAEFENDPKKAFTGKNTLIKNPIYIDTLLDLKVPEKVKLVWKENYFTIRKSVSPDLKVEKVIDIAARKALQKRLKDYEGDRKKAFVNLDENPIWLNEEKGIQIKRVTITGVSNVESLHFKKDHLGNAILDEDGNQIPVDYVSTGNNHHVAIYKDADGNLQEKVVSFFEAVTCKNRDLHVIDKSYNSGLGWQFLFTMKQNEMFVFPNELLGFNPLEIDLENEGNYAKISPNLFRVQKISTKNYFFRHHLETDVSEKKELKMIAYKRLGLLGIQGIVKIRINHLGQIVKVGEY